MLKSSSRHHIFNLAVIEQELSKKFKVSKGWGVSDVWVRYSAVGLGVMRSLPFFQVHLMLASSARVTEA